MIRKHKPGRQICREAGSNLYSKKEGVRSAGFEPENILLPNK